MNEKYSDGLLKIYGNTATVEDKSQRFKSDFKFEEMVVGFKMLNSITNTISTVTQTTSNSIEVFNTTNKKNVDASGKRKGIDCLNWYTWDEINRTFKRTKQ